MSEGSGTGDAARRCVGALVERRREVAEALAGRSLAVSIEYLGGGSLRVIFTPSGYVGVVPPDEPFDADIALRGHPHDIGAFLRERMSLADAVLAGIVGIRMPESEVAGYRNLRDVVADALEAVDPS